MRTVDEILRFAASRAGELAMPGLGAAPSRKLAVLTCMDARISALRLLGLELGEAHVIRNAGGIASTDAIRSIAASQRSLGTEEVVVIMHDGCGLHGASEEQFAEQIKAEGGIPRYRLGAFEDLDATLRESLERLRQAPELLHRDGIVGFIFDPETGTLRPPAEVSRANRRGAA